MMGQVPSTNGRQLLRDPGSAGDGRPSVCLVYGQENWKATPKLTLNLGLRYDVSIPRTDRFNRQNWFDPTATCSQVPGSPPTGGEVFASAKQRHIVNTDLRDIQPRFGFAYRLARRRYVRGGYGIYYSQSRSGATGVAPVRFAGLQPVHERDYRRTTTMAPRAYLHLSNPYPTGLIQPPGNSLGF